MERVAFKMKLKTGFEEEYKKRHDEIWPELEEKLTKAGVSDYSIFWDEETNILFAVQKLDGNNTVINASLLGAKILSYSYKYTKNQAHADLAKQAVIAGLGFSIMPLIGIKNELKNGDLQIIPYKGLPLVTNWNLVWHKSKKLSPTAVAYLDFISAEKDRIIKENFDWYEAY